MNISCRNPARKCVRLISYHRRVVSNTNPQETDPEKLNTVRHALAELTNTQREVVDMRYGFNGFGSTELRDIASHLAIPLATTKKRHERAIKYLRRLFSTGDTRKP